MNSGSPGVRRAVRSAPATRPTGRPCARRKPSTVADHGNCSARRRAVRRRSATSTASNCCTASARQRGVEALARPASPSTSGSAECTLENTGVPQASASSAARPKVSTGPGASTTSAAPSRPASRPRSGTNPSSSTGKPYASSATEERNGPSPATSSRIGTPRRISSRAPPTARSGRFSFDSRLAMTSSTSPSPHSSPRAEASGRKSSRSTPSGTRRSRLTPIRANSRSAQAVVQTTSSKLAASARFDRSAQPSSGNRAGSHCRSHLSSRS